MVSIHPLVASGTLFLAILLAPAATAATSDAEVLADARCQGDLHTVQLICFHETPKEYLNCYLVINGPLRWTECL